MEERHASAGPSGCISGIARCWYRHDVHPLSFTARETALADHVPPRCFAKTVIVHFDRDYAMAALPADRGVNLDELRDAFGCGHLRLATEHEVAELFADCELGAMPPMGNGRSTRCRCTATGC